MYNYFSLHGKLNSKNRELKVEKYEIEKNTR